MCFALPSAKSRWSGLDGRAPETPGISEKEREADDEPPSPAVCNSDGFLTAGAQDIHTAKMTVSPSGR